MPIEGWKRQWIGAVLAAGVASATLVGCGAPSSTPPSPEPASGAGGAAVRLPVPDPANGDGGLSEFYSAPPANLDVLRKPGQMIRTEPLPAELSLPSAARADRVVYSSTNGLDGKTPVMVSGAVFLPRGNRPAAGWPVIAWAHGTVGVADVCAPSNNKRSERDAAYLDHWLDQGYAVVATDYQGLGTPGGHPYRAVTPGAYSTLDSVRAAQAADYGLAKETVLVGQSQGAAVVIAAAAAAATYAPDLDLRGTVATGPNYVTPQTPKELAPEQVEPDLLAYEFLGLHLIAQTDPTFRPDDVLTDRAKPTFGLTRTACLSEVSDSIEQNKLTPAEAFTIDPKAVLAREGVGPRFYPSLALGKPVFIGTGGKDVDSPTARQLQLFQDACAAGSTIEQHVYPELAHSATVNASLADSTPFVRKVFDGEAIAGNCPKHQ